MQSTPYRILSVNEPLNKTLVTCYVKPQSGHTTKYRSESNAGAANGQYSSTNIDSSIIVGTGQSSVLGRTIAKSLGVKVITDAELDRSLKYKEPEF